MLSSLPSWAGTIPQWITATGIVTLIGFFLTFLPKWVNAQTERRKVLLGAEEGIRDHYATEVTTLRAQLAAELERHARREQEYAERERERDERYRSEIAKADQRHDECVKDREEKRRRIEALEDKVTGLTRQISRYSADKVIYLDEDPANGNAKAAAKRVKQITEDGGK